MADAADRPAPLVTAGRLTAEGQLACDRAKMRAYARKVRDPEHFEQLVQTINDPEMREAVRKMLIPLLSFKLPDADLEDEKPEAHA